MDCQSCQCQHYEARNEIVSDCIKLTYDRLEETQHWLPPTCAYRLLYQGKPLFDWHPLISKNPLSVHENGISIKEWAISETTINLNDLENYIIEELPQ